MNQDYKPEPTALDVGLYMARKTAEWGCYILICVSFGFLWIGTP